VLYQVSQDREHRLVGADGHGHSFAQGT